MAAAAAAQVAAKPQDGCECVPHKHDDIQRATDDLSPPYTSAETEAEAEAEAEAGAKAEAAAEAEAEAEAH